MCEFLGEQFPAGFLTLSAAGYRDVLARLSAAGFGGGAVYDAVVGATAVESHATLVTRDHRAIPVYELIGAEVDLIE